MGNLFGGGPKSPKPIAPAPLPTQLAEEVQRKEQDRRRQKVAAYGRQGTILTQGQPLTGSATLLGRSTS